MHLPDLSTYRLDRVVAPATVRGTAVPGLRAEFYRAAPHEEGPLATAGLYLYRDVQVFIAWGRSDRPHCDWHTFRDPGHGCELPRRGCPRVRVVGDPGAGVGLLMRTRNGDRVLRAAQPAGSRSTDEAG
jgi:hypothetical protein